MPMFVKSALKAIHGGCVNNVVWKFVPSVDDAVAESICTNIEP